jgi:predicted nucleic acid-binding protein
MIVVADTSPINYLVLVEAIDVLPALYQTVVIPKAVLDELQAPETPETVRRWTANPPDWLKVDQSAPIDDPRLDFLDPGESRAILLVQELRADALIIDDRAGRAEARKRDIFVIGTLGVLSSAAANDLIDLEDALEKLQRTSFRASASLISQMVKSAKARKEDR